MDAMRDKLHLDCGKKRKAQQSMEGLKAKVKSEFWKNQGFTLRSLGFKGSWVL
jgi:hypothetical protein